MADAIKDTVTPVDAAAPEKTDTKVNGTGDAPAADDGVEQAPEETTYPLTIVLPQAPGKLEITVSPHEQVHEVRQAIIEFPVALQYSCFHLEHKSERVNDFIQISEIKDIGSGSELHLVEDPYTEKEARLHMVRVRELIGASGDRTDAIQGVLAGLSLFEKVAAECGDVVDKTNQEQPAIGEYDFSTVPSVSALLPDEQDPAPKTVKGISLSPWNPPPAHLRQKGHLLYLIVTTNEGEQFQITAHVGGFYVNKSSNAKFDPFPRQAPKAAASHSLLTLIGDISPSFNDSFMKLQEYNNRREPLATFQITNAIPTAPWVVPSTSSPLCAHSPDITRTQETFLIAGVEGTDTLRDWNEEFQSAKELPKENVQDRVFRERLLAKLYADYNDAAARGAVMVARGEVAPLNPTEGRDAQIFVYNNVFFSFGADGVKTFTSEGGDEAARVATGKDVAGVKAVNQLDIESVYTPGTVVVDYLGKRIVGQSIVPGIFKQREEGENQIDYGAVDGKDVVAADEKFAAPFAKLSKAMKVKKHPVWDKNNKRFDLEASVETKGLLGTDGRKYVLDLYRITPLDISWLDEMASEEENKKNGDYPHRMTVLRGELVELVYRSKMREWLNAEIAKRAETKKDEKAIEESSDKPEKTEDKTDDKPESKAEEKSEEKVEGEQANKEAEKDDRIDANDFTFSLNPDVFSGQEPQTDEEKAEWAADEKDVRAACTFLRETAIPELLNELRESEASFPMDGASLRNLLHKRGINMRYLGKITTLCEESSRLYSMREICIRDMIVRSFKHVVAKYLKYLPLPLTSACIAHLLNCLLGTGLNPKPSAVIDSSLRNLYSNTDLSFESVTPESLKADIEAGVSQRFRYKLESDWQATLSHLQVLREVCLKLGLQVQAKEYAFTAATAAAQPAAETAPVNGNVESKTNGESKKKKKKSPRDGSPSSISSAPVPHTFVPDDIINVVPIVKDSAPRSSLAEEALEAGRISINQGQRKLGQELLLESLSLHEQIHGILHPEVARVYHQLSMIYFQLDEKEAAVELARKAILVAERTIGVDTQETLLDYLNLALFLHQLGDSRTALEYSKHALKLWKTIYGPDHPDTITTMNNAAVMLQHLKAYHESRRWFEESLRVCDKIFGKTSINSATLQFQLAQALALDNDSKAAVHRMRESYNIFLQELGPADKNTKEAESWLEQLTQNAVNIAKRDKVQEARQLRAGMRFTPRTLPSSSASRTSTTGVVGGPATGPASDAVKPALDSRTIDELVKFIEGSEKKSSKGGKKTGSKNPKSRRVPAKA
ncbi:Intracellular distribution of mitochondria [Gnomoniopsis sp. IMI 355080]|nr:Intracellular distribution of mitochondria [Gnomoniopsis sp. IMI 355080]